MKLKIESGIPIPELRSALGLAETLRQMKSGDSFVIPEDKRSSVLPTARRLGQKVTTRKIGKDRIRVWVT